MKYKKTIIIVIIIVSILALGLIISGVIFSSKIKVYEGENDYEIVIFDNKKIFFIKDDVLQMKLDTDDFLDGVHYGYVDCPISNQDEDLDCESTNDFFEIYLKDKGNVLLVDNKGNILDIQKDSACKERGSDDFEFYCNYWYVNYKIGDSNRNYYIQETYDSEGSSWYKILHKARNGVLSDIVDVEGFYVGKDGLLEYNEDSFSFYKGDKLKYKSKKYDEIFDIYEDQYVLLEDDNVVSVLSRNGKKIAGISFDDKIKSAEFNSIDNEINISIVAYNKDIHEYEKSIYVCDMNGKCLKESEDITYEF